MIEYEYRTLHFARDVSRAQIRQELTDHAEYGHWELCRSRLYFGGHRRIEIRRKIIRVRRTA